MAPEKSSIIVEGIVREALKDCFRVEIFPDGRQPSPSRPGAMVLAYPSGRMRWYKIKVLPGDHVRVAVSKYCFDRGRIIHRD